MDFKTVWFPATHITGMSRGWRGGLGGMGWGGGVNGEQGEGIPDALSRSTPTHRKLRHLR